MYAIEASGLAATAAQIAADNGFGGIIEVIQGRAEDVELPELADVLISEWMARPPPAAGAVLRALRPRKPPPPLRRASTWSMKACCSPFSAAATACSSPGASSSHGELPSPRPGLFPSLWTAPPPPPRALSWARLWCAPVDLSASYVRAHFSVWQDVSGFDLRAMVPLAAQRALRGPIITRVQAGELLAPPGLVADIDCATASAASVASLGAHLGFTAARQGCCVGYCLFFDVRFPAAGDAAACGEELSTAPEAEPTHWQQSVGCTALKALAFTERAAPPECLSSAPALLAGGFPARDAGGGSRPPAGLPRGCGARGADVRNLIER